jgi:hypothetical protein
MAYIKPSSNYKMSKNIKRELATIVDPQQRGIQKRIMIQAELFGNVRHKEKRPKDSDQ